VLLNCNIYGIGHYIFGYGCYEGLRIAVILLRKRGKVLGDEEAADAMHRRSAIGVRREKAALSSGCKSHPVTAPTGSSRSSYGGDEIAEAFGKRVTILR
jgi:hypothetical protein